MLADAADQLGPHQSLQRIDSVARFLLTTSAALATGLAAAGALSETVVERSPVLFIGGVLLAALSFALGIWATTGRYDEVDVDDLDDVSRFFNKEVRKRSCRVQFSAACFASSILVAAAAFALAGPWDSPKLGVSATLRHAAPATLTVTVDAGKRQPEALLRVVAQGSGSGNVIDAYVAPHPDGSLDTAMTASVGKATRVVRVTVTLHQRGEPSQTIVRVLRSR